MSLTYLSVAYYLVRKKYASAGPKGRLIDGGMREYQAPHNWLVSRWEVSRYFAAESEKSDALQIKPHGEIFHFEMLKKIHYFI